MEITIKLRLSYMSIPMFSCVIIPINVWLEKIKGLREDGFLFLHQGDDTHEVPTQNLVYSNAVLSTDENDQPDSKSLLLITQIEIHYHSIW